MLSDKEKYAKSEDSWNYSGSREKQENTLSKLQSQDFPILFQITHTTNKKELYQTKREYNALLTKPSGQLTYQLYNFLNIFNDL